MNGPDSSFPGYLSLLEVPYKPGAVGAEDIIKETGQRNEGEGSSDWADPGGL
jgi:hypothetical protein